MTSAPALLRKREMALSVNIIAWGIEAMQEEIAQGEG
jgi:hypothetical protein